VKRLGIGVALLALLAGLYLLAHRRRMAAESSLVELRAQQEVILRAARRKTAAGPKRGGPVLGAPAAAVGPANGPRGSLGLLERNPALQADYFAAKRGNIPFLYGPLFRSLHLNPDQIKRLQELIARHDEEFFDTVSATPAALRQTRYYGDSPFVRQNYALSASGEWMPTPPATEDEAAALAYLAQSDARFQSEVDTVGGPGSYDALRGYQANLPYQEIVDGLGAAMAASGAPLSDEESGQLSKVLAQSTRVFADGVDLATALTGAAKVLSPGQFSVLQAQVAEERAANELTQTIRAKGGFGTIERLAAPLIPSAPLH
jgi:hypothetical protein